MIKGDTKIDGTNIYVSSNYSAYDCVSFIRGLLKKYDLDIEEDFVYSARSNKPEDTNDDNKLDQDGRKAIRLAYWQYALPIIRHENAHRPSYINNHPGTSNEIRGSFGIYGFDIRCIANYDMASVVLYLGNYDTLINKEAFDLLSSNKSDIEKELGVELEWSKAPDSKASWISYTLNNVSITNQLDWEKMAQFHSKWSNKICNACLPYLESHFAGKSTVEECRRTRLVSEKVYRWALSCPEIDVDINKCGKAYTRFSTKYMNDLLPPTEGKLSGWGTNSHYYYEIRNYDGKAIRIQLAFNSKNLPEDQREIMDKIMKCYPISSSENWQWRIQYSTQKYSLEGCLGEAFDEAIDAVLTKCVNEIMQFESQLKEKL